MTRDVTLLSLLQDYRSELAASGNPTHNSSVRDSQVRVLQKTQEWLWRKHDWPHLRIRRDGLLSAGQRYYDTPEDLSVDRLETVELRHGSEWVDLQPGIWRSHYSTHDSDLDERSWPAERWQLHESGDIEIWPIPADNANTTDMEGMIRFTGIRNLRPLVADGDRCDLDDDLIVKFAATKALARIGDKAAQLVLDEAKQIERDLTGNFSKKKTFQLFGSARHYGRQLRGMPRVHYRTNDGT